MINDLSIYIHWPFCLSKCPYCDFNSYRLVNLKPDYNLWLDSFLQELSFFRNIISNSNIKSIFFGGGTPSLMEPRMIAIILEYISNLSDLKQSTEITIEVNPTISERSKLEDFKSAGVNRVSIGIQSLIDQDLKMLGRHYNSKQAINTLKHADKIFKNTSFDLLYSRVNQRLINWKQELNQAINTEPKHISLYQLSIEKGTVFYKLYKNGSLKPPNEYEVASLYNWTNSYLTSKGFNRYEITSFSKKNNESVHNLNYWNYGSYLGIGPGSHSRIISNNHVIQDMNLSKAKVISLKMYSKPKTWLQRVRTDGHGIQNLNELKPLSILTEALMMGLRLKKGVSYQILEKLSGLKLADTLNKANLDFYQNLGLVCLQDGRIKLTDKGLSFYNYLTPRLISI